MAEILLLAMYIIFSLEYLNFFARFPVINPPTKSLRKKTPRKKTLRGKNPLEKSPRKKTLREKNPPRKKPPGKKPSCKKTLRKKALHGKTLRKKTLRVKIPPQKIPLNKSTHSNKSSIIKHPDKCLRRKRAFWKKVSEIIFRVENRKFPELMFPKGTYGITLKGAPGETSLIKQFFTLFQCSRYGNVSEPLELEIFHFHT